MPGLLALYGMVWLSLAAIVALNLYAAFPLLSLRRIAARATRAPELLEPLEWPRITLLLAAYREERCLRECVSSIARLDYPPGRLELIIITEVDDEPTTHLARQLAAAADPGLTILNVVVHPGAEPRGKPRALNRGLREATGDIVGVVDAEDLVDPRLGRLVAAALAAGDVDAVQGVLDMANDRDGWLSLQFRAEYGYWFNLYLPCARAAGYPVPFGGTTNFLTRAALERLHGWDGSNLTEDFDLGVRAYRAGLRVATLACVTREESPIGFAAWLRQRTRWQRGKLQTLKRSLRRREGGPGRTAHALLTCLVPHLPALNLISVIASVYLVQSGGALPAVYWQLALGIGAWSLLLCALHGAGYLVATRHESGCSRWLKAAACAATLPGYWLAQWLAELRAVRQEFLEVGIFWEKTDHHMRHLTPADTRPTVNS